MLFNGRIFSSESKFSDANLVRVKVFRVGFRVESKLAPSLLLCFSIDETCWDNQKEDGIPMGATIAIKTSRVALLHGGTDSKLISLSIDPQAAQVECYYKTKLFLRCYFLGLFGDHRGTVALGD